MEQLRFKCLECGKCCNSEIILSYPDIKRIISKPEFSSIINENNKPRLVKGNLVYTTNSVIGIQKRNPCFFLDKNRCKIHLYKPQICSNYPFGVVKNNKKDSGSKYIIANKITSEGEEFYLILIDPNCPGIGQGKLINIEKLFKKCLDEYENYEKTYSKI